MKNAETERDLLLAFVLMFFFGIPALGFIGVALIALFGFAASLVR